MRAAFGAFRLCGRAVCALALACGVGCTANPPSTLAGASDAWAKPSEPKRPAVAPAPTWDAYVALREWPPVNAAPFLSRGHQPEQLVDVRVDPASRASYKELVADTTFPNGSLLAELPHDGEGHGLAMRKIAGAWAFVELDGGGGVLSSGRLELCAGCHAAAPADGVFGLPREIGETR